MKLKFTKAVFFRLSFFGILISYHTNGQIKITTPVERSVYQRGIDGRAKVSVAGTYSQLVDKIEVRAVAALAGQGVDTDWVVLQNNPSGGVFLGSITLLGGWYSLQVRGTYKNVAVGSDVVPRFGVGEVFIIAGQSNAQGLRGTVTKSAVDDRVNYINNYDNTPNTLTDPPSPTFAHLTADANMAPRGQTSWCWGIVGDSLARKLNVPVLFINTAWEGTSVRNWEESSKGLPTYNAYGGFLYSAQMPYANLRLSIRHFANQLGVRAILWVQGEADNRPLNTPQADYVRSLIHIIDDAKINVNKRIKWVIARTSRTAFGLSSSVTSQAVINAQNEVLSNSFYPVYPGPETDPIAANSRPDGTHFSTPDVSNPNGLLDLANAWVRTFTSSNFFSEVTPILPAEIPAVTVACNATNNGITITMPAGYSSYAWNNSSATTRSITVTSPGTYRATLKDADGNAVLGPIINASAGIKPARPSIVPAGQLQACADTGLELSASGGSDVFTWYKDGAATASGEGVKYNASASGSYTVVAKNVFGCTSDVSTASALTVRDPLSKPTIATSGPFSVQASIAETGQNERYEWKRNGNPVDVTNSIVKVTGLESGAVVSFEVRASKQYVLAGNTLTCYSPYSELFEYKSKDGDDVVVFPNPSRGGESIHVESRESLKNVTVAIYNVQGSLLYSKQFSDFDERVSVAQLKLPAGVYILKVTGDGVNLSRRHVVL